MAVIKLESKTQSGIDRKPRVYFTCHPEDFDQYFRKICDDIFATHDCAVYYTPDMTEAIPEEDQETDLGRHNLFVVPITLKLLSTPNRAMDVDIPYALSRPIPVLPLMMEPELDLLYSLPEKFGDLQYLSPNSTDATAISYPEKLKKFLESVLISDALAQRIRAAFDAYIFLSYRKKDRRYANELMQLIHSIPQCRDIAIWFDEFLTPGENFRESIDRILHDSKLFTLLVTPHLLEEKNFVMTEEYPAAQKSGIPILPTEMEDTDRDALCLNFPDIPACVKTSDEAFLNRLLDTVTRLATTDNDTPEHTYLIGLAYLEGIDVEVNRDAALELITTAANAGLTEAMAKLYTMYTEGSGVPQDYEEATVWAQKLADDAVVNYGEDHPDTLIALGNLAFCLCKTGDLAKALALQENVYFQCCTILGEEHPTTLDSLHNLAGTCCELGQFKRALELQNKAYSLQCHIQGEDHPVALSALDNLAGTYFESGDPHTALELQKTAYTLRCKVLGKEHPDTLTTLSNLAGTHFVLGNFDRALELQETVFKIQGHTLGQEHPDTLRSLNNLAGMYGEMGNTRKALELAEKAYVLQCKRLGETHPATLVSLNNLAYTYLEAGDIPRSLELQKKAYGLLCNVLGDHHPYALKALRTLTDTYGQLGDLHKVAELNEKVYHIHRTRLGQEHPDTLMALHNLAITCFRLGDYPKALELLQNVYTLCRKVLGDHHPHTLKALSALADTYSKLGDLHTVVELKEKVYLLRCTQLGEEHPDTLMALHNLAVAFFRLGDYPKALELLQNVYTLRCKVLGATHPSTVMTQQNIEAVKSKLQSGF